MAILVLGTAAIVLFFDGYVDVPLHGCAYLFT